ncbi:MAG: division/cell wall cluster transcriptional repressor MraZ [Bacteroidetes bacterium]|nr:division/cell wall cluster transcriptional repressor MraZ [Bacteroidota bacterium]
MPSFKGQYEHSVDNKGRVAFPAKLRKNVSPDAEDRYTLLRGVDACLYLYPQNEWKVVENKLDKINSFSRKGRTVKRNILRYAEDVTLDKQHRISLPQHLKEWSQIGGTAIFIGSGERIEIWAPEKLDEIDSMLDDDAYAELFEEVMGDEPESEN